MTGPKQTFGGFWFEHWAAAESLTGLFTAMKHSKREKKISLVLWNLPCPQHPPWPSRSGGQLVFTANGISELSGGSPPTSLGLPCPCSNKEPQGEPGPSPPPLGPFGLWFSPEALRQKNHWLYFRYFHSGKPKWLKVTSQPMGHHEINLDITVY